MRNVGGELGTKYTFLPETLETPGKQYEPTALKNLSICKEGQ